MKVAQYEVLGWRSEKGEPSRTVRSMAAYALETTCERPGAERFYRPWRDGQFFLHHFPVLRTGLLSFKSLRDQSSSHTLKS